jgi:hypothetical protein
MENVNTSYGTTSRYLRDDDLIYPCNTVAPRHKYPCYQLATARIRQARGSWRAIGEECLKSEPDWVGICFESMGRDVSGDAGRDTRAAARMCRAAADHEGDCLYGVVREIANADGGWERAARFCRELAAGHRPRCFRGIGTVLAALYPTPADRRRACRRAAGRHAAECLAGGGLTPG